MIMNKPHAHVAWIALVFINLVPLLGVVFFNWQPVKVVMFYWLETLTLGVDTLLRMLCIGLSARPFKLAGLVMCVVFCFHFGLFSSVHGYLILELLNQNDLLPNYKVEHVLPNSVNMARQLELLMPVCVAWVCYGLMTLKDMLTQRLTSLNHEMMRPYKRIAVQQFAILGCAFLSVMLPRTAFLLMLVMVVVKTVVDVYGWKKDRGVQT